MRTRTSTIFTTIRAEGGLLPASLLQRIADGDGALTGLTPEDYHLIPGERLNEVINRSWNRALAAWESFKHAREHLPESDAGTTVTRERWLLPLFQELGYGRLQISRAIEIEGKSYPVSHFWEQTPIHLISFRFDPDRRTPGAAGASRTSPHGLVQEFLNRSDDHLWAFLSNGLTLRILRDNVSLTRQAFVEFDLDAMMEGEVYADFAVLWLLCHQSRVEAPRPEECWLEKWCQYVQKQGIPALEKMRNGVEKAIASLGRGFISYPANRDLRDALYQGGLDKQEFYRQLLRVVYRLIFLFVAEDRDLLFHPDADPKARETYARFYSVSRLRRLAERRHGSKHVDLGRMLFLVFSRLGDDTGCPILGLPALGSFLWSADATAHLNGCDISNADLLAAIRELSFTQEGRVRRPVDYKNLGAEELGSIYESLLELHPDINADAGTFELTTAAGHERKTTGSYYTPTSLITCLLDSSLDPVLDDACRKENPEQAILNLKVCDRACGSGHFLVAAAHRMAKRLAAVRSGDNEPAPDAVRTALRDVIGHCIYGVDINPMSVELCKVSLWLESLEPGKPLSFLDHHIQCGNSLLGTTPALLKGGIPDDAFKPIEGDDADYCKKYKAINKQERKRKQMSLLAHDTRPWEQLGNLATSLVNLDGIDDANIAGVKEKQQRYAEFVRSSGYEYGQLLADAWCAAFVWHKREDENRSYPITEEIFRKIEYSPHSVPGWLKEEVKHLAGHYRFFHWHLAFPDVFRVPLPGETPDNEQAGWCGGFDVQLGNPPWERIKIQEKEWFAERRPDIANARNAAERRKMIEQLRTDDPSLYAAFRDDLRTADGEGRLIRDTGLYPLTARGDINTYAIFAEGFLTHLSPTGRAGFIVPSGIATDDSTKAFFDEIASNNRLASMISFENEEFIFRAVHHSFRFCLLTLTGTRNMCSQPDFVFFARGVPQIADHRRHFSLTAADIRLLNPNTRTCSIFRSQHDAELTKKIYRRVPILINESKEEASNPWGINFMTMFHMANDSNLFRTSSQLMNDGLTRIGATWQNEKGNTWLPLYEAKMIHQFDHRWATYEDDGNDSRDLTDAEKQNPSCEPLPRYWVEEREVYLSVANLPKGLLSALRDRNPELIALSMAHWMFSHWLLTDVGPSIEQIMGNLFPSWVRFVERYPFARSFAPTQLGLAGNNPPCLKPLGPEFLPAEPIDKIHDDDRKSTAWYAADPKVVNSYLDFMSQFSLCFSSETRIDTVDDVVSMAEFCLKQAVPRWFLSFRDVTSAHVLRTVIPSMIPCVGVGHTAPIIMTTLKTPFVAALIANLCSLTLDFIARQKVGGNHLTYSYLRQFPILSPSSYSAEHLDYIVPRVLELTYTSESLRPWAEDLGYQGEPFPWNPERRAVLRAELDAYYAMLYGLDRDELRYILDPADVMGEDYPSETFRVLKNNEMRLFGEYRTRRLILESFDALMARPAVAAPVFHLEDETSYPGNDWERATCAFTLALVGNAEQDTDGLLTALVMAANPDLCAKFLPENQQAQFRALVASAPQALFTSTQKQLDLRMLSAHLANLQAITRAPSRDRGEIIRTGSAFDQECINLSADSYQQLAGLVLTALAEFKSRSSQEVAKAELLQLKETMVRAAA